jgi:hypothetical protein
VQGLPYLAQTGEEADFIRMMYTTRLKKVRLAQVRSLFNSLLIAGTRSTDQAASRDGHRARPAERRLWAERGPGRDVQPGRRVVLGNALRRVLQAYDKVSRLSIPPHTLSCHC